MARDVVSWSSQVLSVVDPGVVSLGRLVMVTVMMMIMMLMLMVLLGHPEVVQYELGEARV